MSSSSSILKLSYLAWTLVMCKRYTVICGYSLPSIVVSTSDLQNAWLTTWCYLQYLQWQWLRPTLTWKKKRSTLLRVRREEQEEAFICLSWSHLLVMVVITIKIVQVKTELKSAKQGWFTLLLVRTWQKSNNILFLLYSWQFCCCLTDLLRAALNVMMPIALDYPHAFAGHFRVSSSIKFSCSGLTNPCCNRMVSVTKTSTHGSFLTNVNVSNEINVSSMTYLQAIVKQGCH